MRVVTDIERVTQVHANTCDNWINRLELRTRFIPTVRGRGRRYTLQNALELACIGAYVKAGLKPSLAVEYATSLRNQFKNEPAMVRRFHVIKDGKFKSSVLTDKLEPDRHLVGAEIFAIIRARELVERVQRTFEAHAVEE